MIGIPPAKDTDAEDVAWGLQTAEALWKRGERIDAIVWLRRAAQSAGDAADDDRALELARMAAELSDWMTTQPSSVPPAGRTGPSTAPLVQVAAAVGSLPAIGDVTFSSVEVDVVTDADAEDLLATQVRVPPRPPSSRPPPSPTMQNEFPQFDPERTPNPGTAPWKAASAGGATHEARTEAPAADVATTEDDERQPSVLPADRLHAGMYNPWDDRGSQLPRVPAVVAPPGEDEDEVLTSVRPHALPVPLDDAPASAMPISAMPDSAMPISVIPLSQPFPEPAPVPPPRASRPSAPSAPRLDGASSPSAPSLPATPAAIRASTPSAPSLSRGSTPSVPAAPAAADASQPKPARAPAKPPPLPPRANKPRVAPPPLPAAADSPTRVLAAEPLRTPSQAPLPAAAPVAAEAREARSVDSVRPPASVRARSSPSMRLMAAADPEPQPEPILLVAAAPPEPDPPSRQGAPPLESPASWVASSPPAALTGDEPTTVDRGSAPPEGLEATQAAPIARMVEATPPDDATQIAGIPAALDLESVESFADLPDDARAAFAAAAKVHHLQEGEEVSNFALVYVVRGDFDVAATMVDAPALRLSTGAVLRARGTTDEDVPMRLIGAAESGVVATWSDAAVADAFRTCPWVEDDLRSAADKVLVLVGITIGPMGERIDGSIREQIMSRLTVRPLAPGEILVNAGEPVPGLILVGVGELELSKEENVVAGVVGSGDFLFAGEVLGAGPAPMTARAGKGGALVMFGDRMIAQELLVTCPPLLEVFAGM